MVFCNFGIIDTLLADSDSHNPYFNRWFSAIVNMGSLCQIVRVVTILILIDGFLQFIMKEFLTDLKEVTILILIDGFLQ